MKDDPRFAGVAEAATRARDNRRSNYIGPQTMAELKQALAEREVKPDMSPVGCEMFNFGIMIMKGIQK